MKREGGREGGEGKKTGRGKGWVWKRERRKENTECM